MSTESIDAALEYCRFHTYVLIHEVPLFTPRFLNNSDYLIEFFSDAFGDSERPYPAEGPTIFEKFTEHRQKLSFSEFNSLYCSHNESSEISDPMNVEKSNIWINFSGIDSHER